MKSTEGSSGTDACGDRANTLSSKSRASRSKKQELYVVDSLQQDTAGILDIWVEEGATVTLSNVSKATNR